MGAFFVSLVVTYISGCTGDRSIHKIILMPISVIGNVIVISTTSIPARFSAMFLMPMGAVSAYQIILSWIANSFLRPLVKRSACISITSMIGNCANIYGSYMYPIGDATRYIPGGSATASVTLVVAVLAFVIRTVLKRQNKALAEREVADAEDIVMSLHGGNLEARAAGFRYVL